MGQHTYGFLLLVDSNNMNKNSHLQEGATEGELLNRKSNVIRENNCMNKASHQTS